MVGARGAGMEFKDIIKRNTAMKELESWRILCGDEWKHLDFSLLRI